MQEAALCTLLSPSSASSCIFFRNEEKWSHGGLRCRVRMLRGEREQEHPGELGRGQRTRPCCAGRHPGLLAPPGCEGG